MSIQIGTFYVLLTASIAATCLCCTARVSFQLAMPGHDSQQHNVTLLTSILTDHL